MKRMQGQRVTVGGFAGELRGRVRNTRDCWWVRFDGAGATDTLVESKAIRYGAVPVEAAPVTSGALKAGSR